MMQLSDQTSEVRTGGWLAALDQWMAENPWHPRLLPFAWFIVFLLPEQACVRFPGAYFLLPLIYALQAAGPLWLLWRYRRLTPELTLRFDWTVIPSALLLLALWVGLGWWAAGEWPQRWEALQQGQWLPRLAADQEPPFWERLKGGASWLFLLSLLIKTLGMSLVVPVMEELFTRSALLRGLSDPRRTGRGLMQLASDLPVLGEWIHRTESGRRAMAAPPALTQQLRETPMGVVTLFGATASTLIFMANHGLRDWLGCIACGTVWCGMIAWQHRASVPAHRRPGLGPVIWSHGLVNALLVGYSAWTGDWQFL